MSHDGTILGMRKLMKRLLIAAIILLAPTLARADSAVYTGLTGTLSGTATHALTSDTSTTSAFSSAAASAQTVTTFIPINCSHTDSFVTGTIAETTLFSGCSIASAMVSSNSTIQIVVESYATNNTNTKTLNIDLGATRLATQDLKSSDSKVTHINLYNRNSKSLQYLSWYVVSSAGGVSKTRTTANVNFLASSPTLSISCILSTPTDTCTIGSVDMRVITP